MRCKVCREHAVVDIRRHNAAFCQGHFLDHISNQVAKTIKEFEMFGPEDRLLVAVSGGKDSLALWDLLLDLGYDATGFYLDLGIGGYSSRSKDACIAFAASRDAKLIIRNLAEEHGYTVPELSKLTRRAPCSGCGLNKRYEFNRAALEEGFDILVTGHNLDDEVATLFGNVLHWNTDMLARQAPVLEERLFGSPGSERTVMVRKVKPRSARPRPTRCSRASTTSSRSARWSRATRSTNTKRPSLSSRSPRPARRARCTSGS
jgi:tRNA-5-methyluridine54 2-sulfurtransferase